MWNCPANMMKTTLFPVLFCACAAFASQEEMRPLPIAKFEPPGQISRDVAASYNHAAELWQKEMPGLLLQTRESGRADLASPSGFAALHYAAMTGDLALAEDLLGKGADANAIAAKFGKASYFSNTPLGFALGCDEGEYPNRAEMVRLLLKHGADPDTSVGTIKMNYGSPLTGYVSAFRAALWLKDERQRGEILQMLLENGDADWQKRCREGKIDWWPMWMPRMPAVLVERMLQKGFDPNVVGEKSLTALHFAVREGNEELVAVLLKHGADPNPKSRYMRNPLFLLNSSLKTPGKAIAIASMLIDHGADVNAMSGGESLRIIYGRLGTKEALALCAYLKSRGALLHPDAQKGK